MNIPILTGHDAASVLPGGAKTPPGNPPEVMPPPRSIAAGFALCGLVAFVVLAGFAFTGGWSLPAIVLALGVFLLVLGLTIVHSPFGALVNSQNLMSLSRFQMAVWTIVVLSAYFSYALARIRLHAADPLNITIDSTLLTLMGISAASFVGSPLILGTKKDKEPASDSTAKTAVKSGESFADVDGNRQGTLYANTNLADARLTDMFQGDEIGNTMHIDLAKVQMFFFTIIAAIAYLVMVFEALRNCGGQADKLLSLPLLSPGLVTAMGISHAGYLGSKGLDHTPAQK